MSETKQTPSGRCAVSPGSEWIDCNDQLPAHRSEIFFVQQGSVQRGAFYESGDGVPCFVGQCRYWHPAEGVTHWMPSPTPTPPNS